MSAAPASAPACGALCERALESQRASAAMHVCGWMGCVGAPRAGEGVHARTRKRRRRRATRLPTLFSPLPQDAPDSAAAYASRAHALAVSGQWERACHEFGAALRLSRGGGDAVAEAVLAVARSEALAT